MQTETLRKAIETGVNAAIKNLEFDQVKETVSDAIEDRMATTRRGKVIIFFRLADKYSFICKPQAPSQAAYSHRWN
jgi:hypothetical protein